MTHFYSSFLYFAILCTRFGRAKVVYYTNFHKGQSQKSRKINVMQYFEMYYGLSEMDDNISDNQQSLRE